MCVGHHVSGDESLLLLLFPFFFHFPSILMIYSWGHLPVCHSLPMQITILISLARTHSHHLMLLLLLLLFGELFGDAASTFAYCTNIITATENFSVSALEGLSFCPLTFFVFCFCLSSCRCLDHKVETYLFYEYSTFSPSLICLSLSLSLYLSSHFLILPLTAPAKRQILLLTIFSSLSFWILMVPN